MNKLFYILLTLLAFNSFSQDKDYSLAKVGEKIQGVYIFIGSEPYQEYDFIATIEVNENWYSDDEAFDEIIRKAKKKHPYFNGIIFSKDNFFKADIIKFKGLENSGGGFRVGDNIVYRKGSKPSYGEIISLNNTKQKATFKYLNIYGEEKVVEKKYTDLSPLTNEQYLSFSEEYNKEIEKYKYKIGEKATWIINKDPFFGEIVSLDNKNHKASIQYLNIYGEVKIKVIEYLKIEIISEENYSKKAENWNIEVDKFKFTIGEKVSWIKSKVIEGEIVSLNNKTHKASVKYINKENEEQLTTISYLKLTKIK